MKGNALSPHTSTQIKLLHQWRPRWSIHNVSDRRRKRILNAYSMAKPFKEQFSRYINKERFCYRNRPTGLRELEKGPVSLAGNTP